MFQTSLGNIFASSGEIAPPKQPEKKTILSAFTGLDLKLDGASATAPVVSAARQRLALKQAEAAAAQPGPFMFPKVTAPVIKTGLTQAVDAFDSEITKLSVGDRRAKAKTLKSSKAARRKSKLADRAESYDGKMDRKAVRQSKRKQRRDRLKNVY